MSNRSVAQSCHTPRQLRCRPLHKGDFLSEESPFRGGNKRGVFDQLLLSCCVVAAALFVAGRAGAGGFQHYEHSALSTGMANARTALWDDASSLYFNPAAVTELAGFQLSLGDSLMTATGGYTPLPEEKRSSPTDGEHSSKVERVLLYPFHLYFTAKVSRWLTLGIGVTNQFGLSSFWPEDWDGRFTAWQMELKTFFFQPTAAVDVARLAGLPKEAALGVAIGLDYVYATVMNRTKIDFSSFGAGAEADLKVEGEAHGIGVNFALFAAWKPWVSLGASVRSDVNLRFSGDASFSGIDPQVNEVLNVIGIVLPESTKQHTSLRLPWNMNFGVAFHGLKRFTFALDLYVTFWQSYDELRVVFDCVRDGACYQGLNEDAVYPKKWKTGYQVSLGVEYRPLKALAIRIGYGHTINPTNPEYYDAVVPDGNRHIFCVGLGYRAPKIFKLDMGYLFAFWSNEKNNKVGAPTLTGQGGYANGSYEIRVHVVSLSLGFSFGSAVRSTQNARHFQ